MSFTGLFMLYFLLMLIGKKLRVPLFSLSVLVGLFFAWIFKNSPDFTHFELPQKETQVERVPMEQYLYHWILQRKDHILASDKKFPVVLVSSEGGGSRAGLWAFLVHSYLYERSKGSYFNKHLLSLTGASGGSVGNSMFFGVAQDAEMQRTAHELSFVLDQDKGKAKKQNFKYKASEVYQNNYLSTSLLAFLGRDFFKVITNWFQFKDRGALLEQQWSDAFDQTFSDGKREPLLKKELLSYYDIEGNVPSVATFGFPPLLLLNVTHTQTGRYTMISPVDFEHLDDFAGIEDFLNRLRHNDPYKSIALSTAMRVNASFPYITPVGTITTTDSIGNSITHQYTDAGYYDNIGGTVTQSVATIFEKIIRTSFPELKKKIKLVRLLIVHEKKDYGTTRYSQLLAPLATLSNVRKGHTRETMKKLGDDYVIELRQTSIRPAPLAKDRATSKMRDTLLTPVLPLGRYLSTIVIQSMERRLEEVKPQLDAILEVE